MRKLSIVIIILLIVFLAIPSNEDVRGIIEGQKINSEQITEIEQIGHVKVEEQKGNGQVIQDEIAKKIIRFHVIANSDSDEDQTLKLKVRDEVLKFIAPKLKESKSIDESRNIIMQNDENIKKLAKEIINQNGYDYSVKTTLGQCNFPIKEYGNIILPDGEYEAYRIVIGDGDGKNWWCVMFPPLCFVDITKGQVAYEETKEEMKTVLNDEEYSYIDKDGDSNNEELKDNKCNNTDVEEDKSKQSKNEENVGEPIGSQEGKSEDTGNVENKESVEATESGEIEVRFKIVDAFQNIFKK